MAEVVQPRRPPLLSTHPTPVVSAIKRRDTTTDPAHHGSGSISYIGRDTSMSSSSSSSCSSTSTPTRQRRKISTWLNWWRGKAALASGRLKSEAERPLNETSRSHVCTCGMKSSLLGRTCSSGSDRGGDHPVSSVHGSTSQLLSVLPTSSNSWKETSPDLFPMDSSPCDRNPPMETNKHHHHPHDHHHHHHHHHHHSLQQQHQQQNTHHHLNNPHHKSCACYQNSSHSVCQAEGGRDLLYLRLNSNSSSTLSDDLDLGTRLDFMVNVAASNPDLTEETDCDTALFVGGNGKSSKSPFLSGRPASSVTKGNKPFRSKFPSPFRNRKYMAGKNLHPGPGGGCAALYSGQQTPTLAKNIPYSALSSTNSPTQPLGPEEQELEAALGLEKPSISKEELLRLYIQKLDEEANYFKASSPTEDDLCDCPKCQTYYIEYYARYLEQYEARREYDQQQEFVGPLEASYIMDDIMNNGISFCSIM
ncbi:uncharacterized protein LOC131889872 isoform X2 [Tigriopus californicus]|nr:uncharacterized protein LOC131889872 isoform X2 [Tigriopus californicus]